MADSNSESDTIDSERAVNTETETDTASAPGSDSVVEPPTDSSSDTIADTDTPSDRSTTADSESESESESDTVAPGKTDSDTLSDTQTETAAGTESESGTGSGLIRDTATQTPTAATDNDSDIARDTGSEVVTVDTATVVDSDIARDTGSEVVTVDTATVVDSGVTRDTGSETVPTDTATATGTGDDTGRETSTQDRDTADTVPLPDAGWDAGEPVPLPNVLLIVIDDMGYADFEPFDHHDQAISTPNLTRLADSGIVFNQAYTTGPVCSPSRAGLNTGKNQIRWDSEEAGWRPGIPDDVLTIAEHLQGVEYNTSRIGKSDYGMYFHRNDVREYPLFHGFDEFLGFSAHAHDYWLLSAEIRDRTPDPNGSSAVLGPLMHNLGEKSYDEGYLTDIFSDEAIEFVQRPRDTPFFLTLAYNSLHHLIHEVPDEYLEKYDLEPIPNYDPDDMVEFGNHTPGSYLAYYDKYSRIGALDDNTIRKFYLANLDCLDDNIGRVLDGLEEAGLHEETIVVFLSDNGGSPVTGANNTPLTGGKYSLWEGGIRVPMVLSWPGQIAGGQVEDTYVSTTDILPTIADLAGLALEDETIDGINLLEPDPERVLVWQFLDTWAIRQGDWKLTNADEENWKGPPSSYYIPPILNDFSVKLFNLAEDPEERINRADAYPERVDELQAAYQAWCDNNFGRY